MPPYAQAHSWHLNGGAALGGAQLGAQLLRPALLKLKLALQRRLLAVGLLARRSRLADGAPLLELQLALELADLALQLQQLRAQRGLDWKGHD